MAINTMQDLFVHVLRDMYHAEKQLVRALPKMAKAASDEKLREAITMHLDETRNHVERLNEVFDAIDVGARGVRCEAIEGLVEEAKEILEEVKDGKVKDGKVKDAGIIVAAQKVEHYEISSYGSLASMARQLGHDKAAELLDETLAEEKQADEKLSKLALAGINKTATGGSARAAR
jgi:ferritin-like metal-binding protein YciE